MSEQKPEAIQQSAEMLSIRNVATSLGVSKATVLRWIGTRKIEGFFQIGKKWLIRKTDFDGFINQKITNSNN
jgi:excisionase family DNA binding protein